MTHRSQMHLRHPARAPSRASFFVPMSNRILTITMTLSTQLYDDFEANLPELNGKTMAITGSTSGLGLVFAKTVAKKGASVIMLNRESERADKALAVVKEIALNPSAITSIGCDLSSFESVRSAAKQVRAACPDGLDVLVNNAGIMTLPNSVTKDGYSAEMQTNHLSHFLLTAELWPLLEAKAESTGDARVVSHSSPAATLAFSHVNPFSGVFPFGFRPGIVPKYFESDMSRVGSDMVSGRFRRYIQTKLANLVFTHGLASKQSVVKVLVAHPGIADSSLRDSVKRSKLGLYQRRIDTIFDKWQQSTEDGALGILSCACLPEAQSGELWGPEKFALIGPAVSVPVKDAFAQKGMLPIRTLEENVARLWEVSVKATGASFPF